MPLNPYAAPTFAAPRFYPPTYLGSPGPDTLALLSAELFLYLSAQNLGVTIYPGHIPEKPTKPAISYFVVTSASYYTMKRAAGLSWRRYQFDFWSSSYLEVDRIERLFEQKLNGFKGSLGPITGVTARLEEAFDAPYETAIDSSDRGTYHRIAEYKIFFQESVPVLY